MNKREFLGTTALGLVCASSLAQAKPATAGGAPVLLTVSGAIGRGNRGPLDPALDQMMKKQGVKFDRAHAFDFASLTALPSVSIKPTLEYDAKQHSLRGPLLTDVLEATGAPLRGDSRVILRAIDGYAPAIGIADARKYRFILATHIDGRAIPLGGLGPLWAVFDADRFGDMAAKALNERFASCPWGLYHIEVQ